VKIKKAIEELTLVAIVFGIKELPEYLYRLHDRSLHYNLFRILQSERILIHCLIKMNYPAASSGVSTACNLY
jgi:hypothetical protein